MSAPLDREEVRRRLLLRLFGSPLTLVPVLGGSMVALAPFFLNADPALPVFIGLSSVVGGLASLAIRGLRGRERISHEVLEELEQEFVDDQEARLDALSARLERDQDPRDEALLKDARALVKALRQSGNWREQVNVVAAQDMLRGVDELFAGCIAKLERMAELQEMAAKMATQRARVSMVNQREQLIAEVEGSITALSELLTELETFGATRRQGADLEQIQGKLRRSLAAAQATARETDSWEEPAPDPSQRSKRHKSKERS